MALEIIWLNKPVNNLRDIFDYYKYKANPNVASKIVRDIVASLDILITNPKLGQKEELLLKRKTEYRYIVSGNYKIIYSFDKSSIFVHLVFDSRQNPIKLKKL